MYRKGDLLHEGGEGFIYEIRNEPHLLMKIYRETDVSGDKIVTHELEAKLTYMKNHPPQSLIDKEIIAWPMELIYTGDKLIGFVMPKLNFESKIQRVYNYKHPIIDQYEYDTYPKTQVKIGVAVNLAYALYELHRAGYVVGDLNHENIGIDKEGQVKIVDCDSFHITDENGAVYRTNVIMAGYLAPEIIRHCKEERAAGRPCMLNDVAMPTFTVESDRFCLAVHVFQLLMNGISPFNGVVNSAVGSTATPFRGNTAIERNAYVFASDKRPASVFCPFPDTLPPRILMLFNQTFLEGHNAPWARPGAEQWHEVLMEYYANLKQCKKVEKHQYYAGLEKCPFCDCDDRWYEVQEIQSEGQALVHLPPPPPSRTANRPPVPNPSVITKKATAMYANTDMRYTIQRVGIVVGIVVVLACLTIFGYFGNRYSTRIAYDNSNGYNIMFVGENESVPPIKRNIKLFDKDEFEFKVSDDKVIASEDGKLKPLKTGSADVTVSSLFTELEKTEKWYVLEFKQLTSNLEIGASIKLYDRLDSAVINQIENAYGIVFYDEFPDIVTFQNNTKDTISIDEYGNVTGLSNGPASIDVLKGNTVITKYRFFVTVKVQELTLAKSAVLLELGESYTIEYEILPANATAAVKFSADGIKVTEDGKVIAPSYTQSIKSADYTVTVTAGTQKKVLTVKVRNSYTWEWGAKNGVRESMTLGKTLSNCQGFKLGLNLESIPTADLGKEWNIYVYDSGAYKYTWVGSIPIKSDGEWFYKEFNFPQTAISAILVEPPPGCTNYRIKDADLSRLNYGGLIH
jgi:serine/threonine protein kinase